MSEHYQITNSTSDFKSRTNDIFDKLINLEKQHDDQTKTQTPFLLSDEDVAASSKKNPSIPTHAITFKKRAADDNSETFTRPTNKWKKYDLDDVNEHHMSGRGNQHALNDFLRTRTKPVEEEAAAAATPSSEQPVFKRPMKKEILTTEDDEQGFTPIRAPISTKSDETIRHDNDDETKEFKLTAIRKPTRGVFSTNEKKPVKTPMEITEEKSDDEEKEEDDEEENDEDELFEP